MKSFTLINPYEVSRNGRQVVVVSEKVKVGEERQRKANAFAAGSMRVPLEGIQGIKYDFEVEAYNKGLAEDARLREELQRGER